ncbi:hypothetical protein EVAR_76237_1 [Eumeta japonica]|uniref:Uncharacterized protein n=1 Tax=Eumeta variegata TaxID=151549 RepID=A0A4C1UQ84_EUMVA|nr:hypothetical protein EVAR_76237_1 [Eumeta japonica]
MPVTLSTCQEDQILSRRRPVAPRGDVRTNLFAGRQSRRRKRADRDRNPYGGRFRWIYLAHALLSLWVLIA